MKKKNEEVKDAVRLCPRCKSEVSPDATRCPNCNVTIWRDKDKKLGKRVLKIFGFIFLALFIILIIVGINTPSSEEKCKDAKVGNLEEIYELKAKDVPKAEELYKDKYFKFTGKISKKYKNYIQIESNYISADVYFAPDYKDKANELNVGDTISYCGKINFGMAIQVKNACIIENED